jgi:hypothetical protein
MSLLINTSPSEFLEAKADLEARLLKGSPEPSVPRALQWSQIETLPALFQPRRIEMDESQAHIQTLARAIKRGPRGARQASLAAITVFWGGDAWVCVDGHHRLWAYAWVAHPAPVPVKVLRGATLGEAIGASLGGNSKDKKALSPRCKSEAAWRLTMEGSMSKATIAALADVDESTIAIMRRTATAFTKEHPEVSPGDLTWAKMRLWKLEPAKMDDKDAEQRAADKLLRRIDKHLKGATAGVLLRALGMHNPGLVAELFKIHQSLEGSASYDSDPFPYIPSEAEEIDYGF